jgi:hypothetical protein
MSQQDRAEVRLRRLAGPLVTRQERGAVPLALRGRRSALAAVGVPLFASLVPARALPAGFERIARLRMSAKVDG